MEFITSSSSKSVNILEQIPIDLIVQILSKLTAKSIARSRCVSKDWNSILRTAQFTNLFFKMSSSRHHLLFVVQKSDKCFFFSAPQPLNPEKNSSPIIAHYHMCFPLIPRNTRFLAPINGLSCTGYMRFERGSTESKVIISNPSNGQCITIPIMRRWRDKTTFFFGYDPINKQYKVLCLLIRSTVVIEHKVMTLGTEKPIWKRIECSLSLRFPYSPICLNGILYYLDIHGPGVTFGRVILVCFDVRSEKFKFIETDKIGLCPRLINYKGKLAIVPTIEPFYGKTRSLELSVLDDVEKTKWSPHTFVFPPLWKDLVADMTLYIVGMTRNGELVFSSYVYDPFYIFFYNVENNTIARVRIQGMEENYNICTFIDHVENVKLI